MTNLNPEFCLKIKEARRTAGLSQSVVAAEVGCKQSALSMFEQGNGTKLNDDVIEKLAKKFGVKLPVANKEASVLPKRSAPISASPLHIHGFCPNPLCPSNHSYEVEGRSYLRPDRTAADPAGGKFCALCGEVLEKKCPNCGAPVHDGAICSFCGDPYIPLN